MSTIKCTAAGDSMVLRRLPGHYDGFEALRDFILQGDFRFFNLETTVHHHETYGAAVSGGTWLCSPPEVLEDAKSFGFNILTTANNHALDYAHIGLEKTLDYVRKAGFPNAGVGRNMAEASAPVYLDTLSGRIALISACSTFTPEMMAGEQSSTVPGRPGINGIRFQTTYRVSPEDLQLLKQVADRIGINNYRNIIRKEGYLPPMPENKLEFGDLQFEVADTPGKRTTVNPTDMARVEKAIREARYFADYVIVSMHSHEIKDADKSEPDQFYEDFAHKCIDAGAHAVIGHGPHLLRPLEIYKNCPIFYSLGDFVIQLENIRKAPADMYEDQKLSPDVGIDLLLDNRNHHGTRGLCYEKVMYEAIVPYWEAENGKLTKLILMPIELNFDKGRSMGGWPRPKYDEGILERLAKMSAPYGTEIEIDENGLGIVKL